jgi:hypothetical protein
MERCGYGFRFELPDGWQEFKDDSRYVIQGPRGEVFILSGRAIVASSPTADDLVWARSSLLEGYLKAIQTGVSNPQLVILHPLIHTTIPTGVLCHSICATTTTRDTLFNQVVFESERTILLCTFEAPNDQASSTTFNCFLESVAIGSSAYSGLTTDPRRPLGDR